MDEKQFAEQMEKIYAYNKRRQEAKTLAAQMDERIKALRKDPLKADLLGFLRFATEAVKRLMEVLK